MGGRGSNTFPCHHQMFLLVLHGARGGQKSSFHELMCWLRRKDMTGTFILNLASDASYLHTVTVKSCL
ncbi:hypothetical protein JMJ77_0002863 [Colletotrichum scovillei]|uniref:Uncharacterized protein n=1 Tax=Colletotrichum scovillei TaxID=1209932 RepID=A0A9P7U7G7_9PEZI|nr:hypothetical protein JMJ78_0006073 [Colletotrichum scovillei]KAG7043153.1 hypothetical protein JMJ77_0002863 [Colletotrichum scovillei]KAG7062601.1 hypothetical protein JMJ76_0009448 [Colletotrichum scovillei]